MNFKINALLAIWFSAMIFAVWILSAYKDWSHEGEVLGATIVGITLIWQFFFRKKPPQGTQ